MITNLLFFAVIVVVFMNAGCEKSNNQENISKNAGCEKSNKRENISQAAVEFRLVHLNNHELISQLNNQQGFIPPDGYELLDYKMDGKQIEKLLVRKQIEIDGKNIVKARIERSEYTGKYDVIITLNEDGKRKFHKITQQNVGRQLAVIVDGRILCAPVISTPINSPHLQISGSNLDLEEAKNIAKSLGYDD
ncbi:MAG: hypothetical protein E7039_11600 [Lentisphaerae bacterium]|nr:hypothetical protein [Lentisphaerota bacterium]